MKLMIGATLALALAVPAFAQVGGAPVLVAQAPAKGVLGKKLPLPRKELERLLVGSYMEQVASMVGETPRNTPQTSVWVYEGLSFDEATGRRDSQTFVYFDGTGKVTRLSY